MTEGTTQMGLLCTWMYRAMEMSRNIRKRHIVRLKMQNSPIGHEIATTRHPGQWRHVGDEGTDAYAQRKCAD